MEPELEKGDVTRLLGIMQLIRTFEEKASELYANGQIRAFMHSSIGQEAVAAGVCALLGTADTVYSGHRAHGHLLAKGGDPGKLMAELAGRSGGYCKSKGGSLHLVATDVGFMSGTGIVGGSIPLALGSGLFHKEQQQRGVAAVFFGDGAMNSGYFAESLNIASLWQLPVVFVCENNGYAEFTPISAHTLVERAADHGKLYQIPSTTVDGNDVLAVSQAATEAIERARAGGGPSMVECLTYRLKGHYEGDLSKRDRMELAEWQARDPIVRFSAWATAAALLSPDEESSILQQAKEAIDQAVKFALESPNPSEEELTSEVYA